MTLIAKYFNKVLPKNSANAGARGKLAAHIRSKRVMQKAGHGSNVRSSLIKKIAPNVTSAFNKARAAHKEKMTRLHKTSHTATIGMAIKRKTARSAAVKPKSFTAHAGAGRKPRGNKASLLKTKSFMA